MKLETLLERADRPFAVRLTVHLQRRKKYLISLYSSGGKLPLTGWEEMYLSFPDLWLYSGYKLRRGRAITSVNHECLQKCQVTQHEEGKKLGGWFGGPDDSSEDWIE